MQTARLEIVGFLLSLAAVGLFTLTAYMLLHSDYAAAAIAAATSFVAMKGSADLLRIVGYMTRKSR